MMVTHINNQTQVQHLVKCNYIIQNLSRMVAYSAQQQHNKDKQSYNTQHALDNLGGLWHKNIQFQALKGQSHIGGKQ